MKDLHHQQCYETLHIALGGGTYFYSTNSPGRITQFLTVQRSAVCFFISKKILAIKSLGRIGTRSEHVPS